MVKVCTVFCYCILWLDVLETIYVCIWYMLIFMSVVVTVCESVGMFVVYRSLLKIGGFLSVGVCCLFV